jgi:hypothetical protein
LQRGDQDCRRLAQGCGDLSGVVVGGGGQVAQRDVGRWFGRAGGDDLVRPAQATVDVAAQLRHVHPGQDGTGAVTSAPSR